MDYSIRYVNPCYTGGGIYVYTGQLVDGTWFLLDDMISWNQLPTRDVEPIVDGIWLDADPDEDFELAAMPEWQEEHGKYMSQDEAYQVYISALKWVIQNAPENDWTNYAMEDMRKRYNTISVYLM